MVVLGGLGFERSRGGAARRGETALSRAWAKGVQSVGGGCRHCGGLLCCATLRYYEHCTLAHQALPPLQAPLPSFRRRLHPPMDAARWPCIQKKTAH